jgi:hypothetical protein
VLIESSYKAAKEKDRETEAERDEEMEKWREEK